MLDCLIIEDNFDISRLFAKTIEKKGISIEQIYSGREALARLADIAPRIVLLDMHLPEVNGADILKYIRTQPHLVDCIVIVVSADYSITRTIEESADYVLLKPLGLGDLSQIVDRLLQVQPTVE